MHVSNMSRHRQIREREEGRRKHITSIRSDVQKKWDLFQDELLNEFRYLANKKGCRVKKPMKTLGYTEGGIPITMYAYVYDDSEGREFLFTAVEVKDSVINAMVFPKPPVWKGGDIDKSWFDRIPDDHRRTGVESVWSPGFWEWYPGFDSLAGFQRLSCNKTEGVLDLCVILDQAVGLNFGVFARHNIQSNFSQQ